MGVNGFCKNQQGVGGRAKLQTPSPGHFLCRAGTTGQPGHRVKMKEQDGESQEVAPLSCLYGGPSVSCLQHRGSGTSNGDPCLFSGLRFRGLLHPLACTPLTPSPALRLVLCSCSAKYRRVSEEEGMCVQLTFKQCRTQHGCVCIYISTRTYAQRACTKDGEAHKSVRR